MIPWYVIIIHFILAIILFFVVNWIGEKSKPLDLGYVHMSIGIQEETAPLFNYFFKVLAPVVYLVILVAFFQALGLKILNNKIYWIVIDYWLFRFLFITVRGQIRLLNWPVQILYWVSSIGLSIWVYSIIDSLETILPKPEGLLEELWILIIIFLYSIFNKLEYSRKGAERRINEYILKRYEEFKTKYGGIVDENVSLSEIKCLVYAVMVYEDFNRPKIARGIERIFSRISSKPHTYGVMQVMSSTPLSDEESVFQGIQVIKGLIKAKFIVQQKEDIETIYIRGLLYDSIEDYNPGNPDYASQVLDVYDSIARSCFGGLHDFLNELDIENSIN